MSEKANAIKSDKNFNSIIIGIVAIVAIVAILLGIFGFNKNSKSNSDLGMGDQADLVGKATNDKVLLREVISSPKIIDTALIGNLNNVRYVNGMKYTQNAAGIRAAIADLGGAPGAIILPCGTYNIDSNIAIKTLGVSLIGFGYCTRLNIAALEDAFTIQASRFLMSDLEIDIIAPSGRTGSVIQIAGDQGTIRNVRIAGRAGIHNGRIFTLDNSNASIWNFENVRIPGGVTWAYIFWLRGAPHATVASTHLTDIIASNQITYLPLSQNAPFANGAAALILDTGVDTFTCVSCENLPLIAQNSLAGQSPRWITFANSVIEAELDGDSSKPATTGGVAVRLIDVRNFRYHGGYITSSLLGVDVGQNAQDVSLSNNEFVNIAKEAIIIRSGASGGVTIDHNTFDDSENIKNNIYNTISVEKDASNFNIESNTFKSSLANKPKYLIDIADGNSNNYNIVFNNFAGYSTGDLSDKGRGTGHYVFGNVPTPAIGNLISGYPSGTNFNGDVGFNNKVILRSGIVNSAGLQHARISTGSVAPQSSVALTMTWPTSFPSISYTPTCSVNGGPGDTNANGLRIAHIESVSPNSIVVRVLNDNPTFPALGSLYCIAIHD